MSRLTEIFDNKRAELVMRMALVPLDEVMAQADLALPALDFAGALRRGRRQQGQPALIAEVKQASPSRGQLAPEGAPFRPGDLAEVYADNGAAAISVLTDEKYFKGSLDHLREVRRAAWATPLLRKDFVCDRYQVYEARGAGADAILLIVAGQQEPELRAYQALARQLGMAALIEVHTAEELEIALRCEPGLLGINNRNLHDLTVRLETTLELKERVPEGILLVAESGISTAADIALLREGRRVDAILVGEALITAADVPAKVRELSGS